MSDRTFVATDAAILPFSVGEVVAFREDHPEHGVKKDDAGEVVERAKYGVVQAVGLLVEDGTPAFEVVVYDPHDGAPGPVAEDEPQRETYRATLEEIQ